MMTILHRFQLWRLRSARQAPRPPRRNDWSPFLRRRGDADL